MNKSMASSTIYPLVNSISKYLAESQFGQSIANIASGNVPINWMTCAAILVLHERESQ